MRNRLAARNSGITGIRAGRGQFALPTCVAGVFFLLLILGACSNVVAPNDEDRFGSSAPPPLPGGQPIDPLTTPDYTRDCFWAATEEMNLLNFLYLEQNANYWATAFVLPPGWRLRIRGEFPHARFMSFNIYHPTMHPIGALADIQIDPDAGSENPYRPVVDRNVSSRSYTIELVPEASPETGAAPNTLYNGVPIAPNLPFGDLIDWSLVDLIYPSNMVILIHRIYLPDSGTDRTGGVDLPRVSVVDPNGSEYSGPEACAFLEPALPTTIDDAIASASFAGIPLELPVIPSTAATEEPRWLRFFDLLSFLSHRLDATPIPLSELGLSGLIFPHESSNSYLVASASQRLGPLLEVRVKKPDTPQTVRGEQHLPLTSLRYMSLCSYELTLRRLMDCVYDEEMPPRADGDALILMGRENNRPNNARFECGVAWLEWGAFEEASIFYRQMRPPRSPAFSQAIEHIPPPSGSAESSTMADYYPRARYIDKQAFEALGCPVQIRRQQ